MSDEFDAIYEQGVFRPLEPVCLPDQIRVHLRIEHSAAAPDTGLGSADIVGMLADEPELADQIMADVYRSRESQLLRTPANGSDGS